MGGKVQSGNFAHDTQCSLVEGTRQSALAGVVQSPAGQKASDAAEIAYHRGIIASCKANNNNAGMEASISALRALGTGGV